MSAINESSLMIVGPNRGGRPRSNEEGSRVTSWIPASYHDRLIKLANLHDMSVSSYVNRVITKEIDRAID